MATCTEQTPDRREGSPPRRWRSLCAWLIPLEIQSDNTSHWPMFQPAMPAVTVSIANVGDRAQQNAAFQGRRRLRETSERKVRYGPLTPRYTVSPRINVTAKIARKMKNSTFAIAIDVPAMLVNPNSAAMNPRTRKISAHL